MSGSHSKTIAILVMVSVFSACSIEFNPNLPTVPTPVLYGIINPADSLYSIRLTKTFNGDVSGLDMAGIADSIYYDNARVFMETRNTAGELFERVELEKIRIDDREPGIFATTPNYVYQTDRSRLHITPESFAERWSTDAIDLIVKAVVPGQTDTVQATSRLRKAPRITKPQFSIVKIYLYTDEPFSMTWIDSNGESYFEILVRMRFKEILYDGEREEVAQWVLTGIEANENSFTGSGQAAFTYHFRPENFYSHLRAIIPDDPEVLARIAHDVDFIVLSSNRQLEFYRDVYEIADDYHGVSYTNVTNGLGLFTTYSSSGIYGLEFGPEELDSLADGKYTKGLRFKNW